MVALTLPAYVRARGHQQKQHDRHSQRVLDAVRTNAALHPKLAKHLKSFRHKCADLTIVTRKGETPWMDSGDYTCEQQYPSDCQSSTYTSHTQHHRCLPQCRGSGGGGGSRARAAAAGAVDSIAPQTQPSISVGTWWYKLTM